MDLKRTQAGNPTVHSTNDWLCVRTCIWCFLCAGKRIWFRDLANIFGLWFRVQRIRCVHVHASVIYFSCVYIYIQSHTHTHTHTHTFITSRSRALSLAFPPSLPAPSLCLPVSLPGILADEMGLGKTIQVSYP